MMTVPAKNQRFAAIADALPQCQRGRGQQPAVDRVLEQILGVARRRTVNREDVAVDLERLWQLTERSALVRGQRIARERDRRRHLVARFFGESAIVVSANGRPREGVEELEGLARPERARNAIAEVDGCVDASGFEIGEDGLECEKIAVNVGDDCESHVSLGNDFVRWSSWVPCPYRYLSSAPWTLHDLSRMNDGNCSGTDVH